VLGLAALGWALRGPTTDLTVPIGEFVASEVGDVVVWDHGAAEEVFDALRRDAPPPLGPGN
jgi:hypothetical protein